MIVYVPVDAARALRLRDEGEVAAGRGFAVTASLLRAAGFSDKEAEDAGFTALCHAGVQALTDRSAGDGAWRRLIMVAEPDTVEDLADPYGEVEFSGLRWATVLAFYGDEPEAASAVTAAAAVVRPGESVADALGHAEVDTLLHDHDLLWFDPTELDQLGDDASSA